MSRPTPSDDLDETPPLATAPSGGSTGPDRTESFGRRSVVHGQLLVRVRIERVVARADITA